MSGQVLRLEEYEYAAFPGIEDSTNLFLLYPDDDIRGWLTRGFSWMYAYHHEEAIFCFQQAQNLGNGSCPLASWGISYCNLPNYNNYEVNEENQEDFPSFVVARRQAKHASDILPKFEEALRDNTSQTLQGLKAHRYLIEAIQEFFVSASYPNCGSVEEKELKMRYARKMQNAFKENGDNTFRQNQIDMLGKEIPHSSTVDPNIAALFAESMMMQRPWELFDANHEPMKPDHYFMGTEYLIRCLRESLAIHPNHPGLLHFLIHAMEMSSSPGDCRTESDRLLKLATDHGHLLHMPAHIYCLIGDWNAAVEANILACSADEKSCISYNRRMSNSLLTSPEGALMDNSSIQMKPSPAAKLFYTVYRCHDAHMLIYAAMFCGQEKAATKYAIKLEQEVLSIAKEDPKYWMDANNDGEGISVYLDSFIPMILHVYIRFGKWNEILAFDRKIYDYQENVLSDHPHPIPLCTLHYARGMAFSNTNKLEMAEQELIAFQNLREFIAKKPSKRLLFNNTMSNIFLIAEQILQGEILYRRAFVLKEKRNCSVSDEREDSKIKKIFSDAFAHLRKAVELNDYGLVYDEPWGWMHPARHVLGALLLEQGFINDAMQLYREDLGLSLDGKDARCCHPNNIWSLKGLEECFIAITEELKAGDCEGVKSDCNIGLPPDYEDIMEKLKLAKQICDDDGTYIASSCACKQTWKKTNKSIGGAI